MRVTVKGFASDSDTDFVLHPDSDAERALLLALRGRDVVVVYPSANPNGVVYLRTQVDGVRQ